MRDILAEIVEKKKDIVANAKREMPLDEVKRSLVCGTFAMTHRFRERDWNLIAECKLQSPAKGRLCRRYSVTELARIYEKSGASMLSVHTDPHFLGCNEDFRKVRAEVSLPLLRKDFIIDPLQIYETRAIGADAVLLIVRVLGDALADFLALAGEQGLAALVEVHTERELEAALAAGASIIGINNRDLDTFVTDIGTSVRLRKNVPAGCVVVAESGISTYAVHPGVVASDIWRTLPAPLRPLFHWLRRMITVEEGASTPLLCATAPALAGQSGLYWSDGAPAQPSPAGRDAELARALWQHSEDWTR